MSDDYYDREEEYWAQKYAEDNSYNSGHGGRNKILRDLWDTFWIILGLVTMAIGKSPVFGILMIAWAMFMGKIVF